MTACAVAFSPIAATALDKRQPLRVVTAFSAGGVVDIAGRIIADALTKELGQTVIVDNKPGGDGVIGMMEVVKAKPDGNTLLLGGFGGQLIPPLMKKKFPIDVTKDLTLIARPAGFTNVLVVNKDLPLKTVDDVIKYAKSKPGELNYGSAASGSSDRLTMELFMQRTGTKFVHVPYKGGAPALNDLAVGVIQVYFANLPAAVGLIEGGMIRPIAVTSSTRVSQLPDVPTIQESGVSEFNVTSWISFFGPAGMAPEDVKLLSDAIVKVSGTDAVKQALAKVGFTTIGEGQDAFKASFAEEWARWSKVISAAGIAE
jgi:tripartite-type tricarboxylate transporter receptor subunit TctC